MNEYFQRQIQLWGESTQYSLADKKVAVIGSGGLGSSVSIPLGSSGVGTLYLVDFDTVSEHNIHRQIAFKTTDLDKNKAEILATLLKERCRFVEAVPKVMDFDTFAKEKIPVDLIIDATDNLPTRQKIDEYAKAMGTPWIYGSVEEFNGQVCFMEKASFAGVFKVTDRKPGGIAPPIVMQIASLQANLALRYLAGLEVKKDLLYYQYYQDGELQLQKFALPTS